MPASPHRRFLGAVGAIVLLAGLVVGLPLALVFLAGNPLPGDVPTVDGVASALTSPDDGTLFLGVLTVIGWLAWASFTGSVGLEAYARLTHRATPAVPGLRTQQRLAAGLLTAIAALSASPTLASADAALVDAPPPVVAALTALADPASHQAAAAAPADGTVLHLVQRGEGLLDLQERYGVTWQRIAEANYGVEQSDGRTLQRGQTRIYAGWQLKIPSSSPVTEALPPEAPVTTAAVEGIGAAPASQRVATPAEQPVYEVAQGDWMWHIADRYLDDPQRYPEIAALNPEHLARHGDFPDHIEPGWQLRLPEDAVDGGPAAHATGTATASAPAPRVAPDEPAAPPQVPPPATSTPESPAPQAPPAPAPPRVAPAVPDEAVDVPAPGTGIADAATPTPTAPRPDPPAPATAPAGTASLGPAPVETAADEPSADPAPRDQDADLERLAPAVFAGAGLLAALVFAAAAYQRRRRHAYHRTGYRFTSPAARRLERTLRSARQPLDSERLDAALRALAAALAGRHTALPDIVGALVDDGAVHLLLATPCPDPPTPWQDHGDRWTLVGGVDLPAVDRPLAPLPTLAAVGSQAGIHLLLDLERLGFLTVHGEPARALDLLRYLAAELACNTWSDQVEVLLAGFDPVETELLVDLNPDRVRAVRSIAEGAELLRRRAAAARASAHHAGAADALAGRAGGLAGDAWMPQILLAATPADADLAVLSALGQELDRAGRCAVAVAATSLTPARPGQRLVTVTPDGAVHLRLPWVRASLAAASLPAAELERLAETVRAARTAPAQPVPPAAEIEPWAAGTDAAGALVAADGTRGGHDLFPPDIELTEKPLVPISVPATVDRRSDPNLDLDLSAWYADDPGRPRIGVLGPVTVNATGVPPETRRRLHAELVVFLAQRGARGAGTELLTTALWPDTQVTEATVQLAISRARRWLGTDPAGAPWLSDVDTGLVYRLAEGYLFDWHLFRRLRTRGEAKGDEGAGDLRTALELIRGAPLDNADRARTPGTRNPYPWLTESDIHPDHIVATVVDTAHQLAELYLEAGDIDGVRWAVRQAWCVDIARGYDQPWRDLMRAEYAAGETGQLRSLLAELMELRDAELPEDLAPDTYHLVRRWSALAHSG